MASYSVRLNITPSSFPEIGGPLFPTETKAVKPSKSDRPDYNSYYSEAGMISGSVSSTLRRMPTCNFCDGANGVDVGLDYEKETSKTYKFLGMDVDENFDAIIKMSQGHIVVAHMFDREAVLKLFKRSTRRMDLPDSLIEDLPEDVVRKIATGLKTGIAYDISKKFGDYTGVNPEDLRGLLSIVSNFLDSKASTDTLEYQSILLNLVHVRKNEHESIGRTQSNEDVASYIISSIFSYWGSVVVPKYNSLYSFLSCVDIWGDMNRRITGQENFNNRFTRCVSVTDNATGQSEESMISFTGISRDRSMSDPNVIRSSSASSLVSLGGAMTYGSSDDFDPKDFMVGFFDSDSIDDVYSLNENEMQAMSVLDSLRYIDEDASLCQESYDMNDPEQRGLFVKSSIRSYERNFREFKPASSYDVTDALADMVERGDVVTNPVLVSQSVATDDTDAPVVTSSIEEIDVRVDKNKLLKILKLVYKSTQQVLKGF